MMQKRFIALSVLTIMAIAAYWTLPFLLDDNIDAENGAGTLAEAQTPGESASKDWWLESGGLASFREGSFSTIVGELPTQHEWRKIYVRKNPLDTNNGYHPQNVFHLFSRHPLINPTQEIEFVILSDVPSTSPNKNSNNGVFLYSQYQDTGNYYYAGLTVDGRAVVVKRFNHLFYTLAEEEVVDGEYSIDESPNLLPQNTPITLKLETRQVVGGFNISLWINGELTVEALDDEKIAGPILGPGGLVGVRSDFMNVEFIRYSTAE